MLRRALVLSGLVCLLAGCATPYRPPVLVNGSTGFPGLVQVVQASGARPVDVVLVHGMCTHNSTWAHGAIDSLVKAVGSNLAPQGDESATRPTAMGAIEAVERTEQIAGSTVHFTALVWSPLTKSLKKQLDYDTTGKPTDCAAPGECKPVRASLNGELKDGLLNDCLADALIYQGQSRAAIRQHMVQALTNVIERSSAAAQRAQTPPGPLVLVTESLGSKLAFDALEAMLSSTAPATSRAAAESMAGRLALVFMGANQLPILGLADQTSAGDSTGVRASAAPEADSLKRLLDAATKQPPGLRASRAFDKLSLVAFTDPNDLLSYRLQPSRYTSPQVEVTDVLVSNTSTALGWLARPDKAHMGYRSNEDVAALIACGHPRSKDCRRP